MAEKIIEKITSLTNAQVKETAKLAQKKYRTETSLFLIEGIKPLEAALKNGYQIDKIFVNEEKYEKFSHIRSKTFLCTEAVMKKISTTDSSPEIIAVAKEKQQKVQDILSLNKIVLLENIKDAGNLGTIVRSSVAFGADVIVLVGETVDLLNTKVIRAGVGASFMIPIVHISNTNEIKKLFNKHTFYATKLHIENVIKPSEIDASSPFVVMFGSEADGLSDKLCELADKFVVIEHSDRIESLNLSVAASVVLYEMSKGLIKQ